MKTSVHLPDVVAKRLEHHLCQQKSTSKNKLIVKAITEYLDKVENKIDWSPDFLAWADGEPEAEGLEIDRSDANWRAIEL